MGSNGSRARGQHVSSSQREGDREAVDRIAALRDGLQKLGLGRGRNIRIELRYAGGSAERMQAHAADLVQSRPDVLFASATSSLSALSRANTNIPIVFAQVTDPVKRVSSQPGAAGGNITGFTQHEFSIGSEVGRTAEGAGAGNRPRRADL